MDIETKWLTATITKSADGDTGPGTFEAVLSTPDKDRDGEVVDIKSWEKLPDVIPINIDHDMSVAGTIGSARPVIEDGVAKIYGTHSSDPEAQRVRTKVNEGHVKTMSVEFLRKVNTDTKGVKTTTREIIGGAFTPYPSNVNAVVLTSKAGARNSKRDSEMIQQIHDHALALGAKSPETKSLPDHIEPTSHVEVEISGKRYTLSYSIDADGDPIAGTLTRALVDDATKSAETGSASPDAETESADDAQSRFDLEAQAAILAALPYLGE